MFKIIIRSSADVFSWTCCGMGCIVSICLVDDV